MNEIIDRGEKREDNGIRNILIALNDAYVKYYKVMLYSLFFNNKSDIRVFCYHTEALNEDSVEELKRHVEKLGGRWYSNSIPADYLEGISGVNKWPCEALVRLFVFNLLPEDVERILYLDGDTIVNGNMDSLYTIHFREALFAAAEDRAISHKNFAVYRAVGLAEEETYYNAGVLLVNVSELRKRCDAAALIQFIRENANSYSFFDQDILNAYFKGTILEIDGFRYNCMVNTYHYTQEKKILDNAVVLHFAGGERPWNATYRKHYSASVNGEIWWKYARQCGYLSEYISWKIKNTVAVKFWQIVYNCWRKIKGKAD
jgi:lipopolysaccharide biosynthesis glycosyltransferase